jgi:signal transduction histidine kinase
MEIKACSIEEIIQDTLKTISLQAKGKNIQIIKNIGDDLPRVKADYEKISIVIMNLASNALKFTPTDGTGKIEICVRKSMGKMLVSVSDNGIGIPEEYIDRIFDKFVQVKGKTGIPKEGSGLGLAISKNIINSHGGEIWAKSKAGEGSKFYFTLEICD